MQSLITDDLQIQHLATGTSGPLCFESYGEVYQLTKLSENADMVRHTLICGRRCDPCSCMRTKISILPFTHIHILQAALTFAFELGTVGEPPSQYSTVGFRTSELTRTCSVSLPTPLTTCCFYIQVNLASVVLCHATSKPGHMTHSKLSKRS